MRALRILLAILLAAGPADAQPVVDLLTRFAVPADETAASAPEGDELINRRRAVANTLHSLRTNNCPETE